MLTFFTHSTKGIKRLAEYDVGKLLLAGIPVYVIATAVLDAALEHGQKNITARPLFLMDSAGNPVNPKDISSEDFHFSVNEFLKEEGVVVPGAHPLLH